jgi:hypothetical protein
LLKLSDALFLNSIDISTAPTAFSEIVERFRQDVTKLRDVYIHYSAVHSLKKALHDPNYTGDPYPKIFLGAIQTVMADGTLQVREETKEERAKFNAIIELAKQNPANLKGYELPKLLKGREILYLGDETTTLYPKSGSTE